jgi:hypothetical protein
VVWFGVRRHYEVRQPVVWPLLARRFAPHAEMVASVGAGCCGDMIDRYFLGTFRNFRQLSEVPLAQETVLPTTSLPAPKPYAAIGELKLRTAPRVSDRYDPERSEAFGHAAFGNIPRICLPGRLVMSWACCLRNRRVSGYSL